MTFFIPILLKLEASSIKSRYCYLIYNIYKIKVNLLFEMWSTKKKHCSNPCHLEYVKLRSINIGIYCVSVEHPCFLYWWAFFRSFRTWFIATCLRFLGGLIWIFCQFYLFNPLSESQGLSLKSPRWLGDVM